MTIHIKGKDDEMEVERRSLMGAIGQRVETKSRSKEELELITRVFRRMTR